MHILEKRLVNVISLCVCVCVCVCVCGVVLLVSVFAIN